MTTYGRTDTRELVRLPVIGGIVDEAKARALFAFPEGTLPLVPFIESDKPSYNPASQYLLPVVSWYEDKAEQTWTVCDWPPSPVPASVTSRQLSLWLINKGLLIQVRAFINGLADPTERLIAQTEWDRASIFERAHPLTMAIASGIGLTAEQTDQAFREASVL